MKKQNIDGPKSLADWRERLGLNQCDAAKILGVSQSAYSKYESQTLTPRRVVAKRILAKTGVPAENLMGLAS